ncbi:hypothetical protein GLW08_09010 [Pontibacillus yanchengensis]|uniref:Uncharacterized protein n=2 Tax=Pontibacillus yanchengensis TaxID=462910 RepID=A0A6I4ZTA6_9BACI|nr:hypothetical protein [Pontibacillus yanchengensis]MYL33428.1 hypothetical protein [Pontibacillus yanchengensis]MYL53478.1 hypothetical protein [Pontibacillus yanchengensis]
MGDIIEVIISNVVIIGGVIAFLYNAFASNKKNEEKGEKTSKNKPMPSFGGNQKSEPSTNTKQENKPELQTFAEAQKERYEEMKKRKQESTDRYAHTAQPAGENAEHNVLPDRPSGDQYKRDTLQPYKKGSAPVVENIDKKLSSKRLMESIVMAEVLGAPRSKKPYGSKIK